MSNRREFIVQLSLGSSALIGASAIAADLPMVAATDAQAKALGYVADATKADKAKFPKFAAGQTCGNCALYQGKAGAASGPCPLFAGKQVAAKGWCSAYVKKA
ncbi:high-potential iron-sulfur protein [Rhodoferax ferrireducens]|uniref:high-potential iron-sulfur protein n=1 Tax=Rhodoferax ferrireducens TaxID=192843 RepID=UPI003BB770C8